METREMPQGRILSEAEVMVMIVELRCGARMDQVADHLGINERTVLRYVQGKRDHLLTPEQQKLLQPLRRPSRRKH